MGRKHNDVFVLGSEVLPSDLRDEKTAEPAARARPEPGATAASAGPHAGEGMGQGRARSSRGLGHRPLSRQPAANRPNPAERLLGPDGRRRHPLRRTAAVTAAAAGLAVVTARLLSAGGGESADRPATSPAAQIAQAEPTPPAAPPVPVVPSPRPRRGAGHRTGPEHHPRARRSSQSPSEVPPQPVAPAPAVAAPIYPTADAFGFER